MARRRKVSRSGANSKTDSQLLRKIDILAALLLRLLKDKERPLTLRQQIAVLAGLQVGPTEIASIIGRTPTYVSKELATLRRSPKVPNAARKAGNMPDG